MEERNNKSNTLLLTVIAVATLLVAVIGATFAYFTARVSGEETASTVIVSSANLQITFADGTANLDTLSAASVEPQAAALITKTFTVTGTNTTGQGTTESGSGMRMPYELYLVVTQNTFQLQSTSTGTSLSYKLTDNTAAGVNGSIPSNTNYVPIPCTTLGVVYDATNAPNGYKYNETAGYDVLQTAVLGTITTYDNQGSVALNAVQGLKLGNGYFVAGADGAVHSYTLNIYFLDDDNNQDYDKNKDFSGYVTISAGNLAISSSAANANTGTEFTTTTTTQQG